MLGTADPRVSVLASREPPDVGRQEAQQQGHARLAPDQSSTLKLGMMRVLPKGRNITRSRKGRQQPFEPGGVALQQGIEQRAVFHRRAH